MFEFDPAKSAANRAKHGIDFIEAQALWSDDRAIVVPTYGVDEERWLLVGMMADKHWTAVFMLREAVVRIMSVRRSRDNVRQYGEG